MAAFVGLGTAEEDAVLRSRLTSQTTSSLSRGDPPLKKLARKYAALVLAAQPGGPAALAEAERAYQVRGASHQGGFFSHPAPATAAARAGERCHRAASPMLPPPPPPPPRPLSYQAMLKELAIYEFQIRRVDTVRAAAGREQAAYALQV